MAEILFKPRWREELEAISDEGVLVFEFTLGQQHVYFPDESRWLAVVPPGPKKNGRYTWRPAPGGVATIEYL